ncbi:hypothetical protein [Methylorubrum aminovorans]|uniref:hypothetical protein n=1 Tax=Methylorubrum aminovorans TaxID=269069 RepID=UPI001EDFE133|nr:hypothetical protein [Methylorubrum aminovorans]
MNLVFLSSGETVSIGDITTAAEGQAILDDLDGAILRIEDDLACDCQDPNPEWRERAEMALKKKRRQRPALQQRIGDLRRSERQAAVHPPAGLGPNRRDIRRKAFINAAEQLLTPEVFTEVRARAAELEPVAFAEADRGAA